MQTITKSSHYEGFFYILFLTNIFDKVAICFESCIEKLTGTDALQSSTTFPTRELIQLKYFTRYADHKHRKVADENVKDY